MPSHSLPAAKVAACAVNVMFLLLCASAASAQTDEDFVDLNDPEVQKKTNQKPSYLAAPAGCVTQPRLVSEAARKKICLSMPGGEGYWRIFALEVWSCQDSKGVEHKFRKMTGWQKTSQPCTKKDWQQGVDDGKVFGETWTDNWPKEKKVEGGAGEPGVKTRPSLPVSPLEPSPNPNFRLGGYFGLGLGGVSQNSDIGWNPNFVPPDNYGVANAARTTLNQTGVAVTGQVGADARFGQVAVGAVFDATYKGGDPTRVTLYASPFGGVFPMRQSFASSFEMTVRGRVGYEFAISSALSAMPYATAGLAMSNISVSDGMYFPTSFNQGSISQFKPGWAAGGGVEFRAGWPFRVQLQYLHMDFGDIAYVAPNNAFGSSFIGTQHRISEDRASIGVNVSFDDMPRLLNGRF
jgi:opacity protein-like surface antigen